MDELHSTQPCQCSRATCKPDCALDVIDSLLREGRGVAGEHVDGLLDLRFLLRHAEDAESALKVFCHLRRALEGSHYLAMYRLRRWLENHIEAQVRVCRGRAEKTVALKLDRFCLEAVRFRCLKAGIETGEVILAPRVRFAFRVGVETSGKAAALAP